MNAKVKIIFRVFVLASVFASVLYSQQQITYADDFNTISGTLTNRTGSPIANATFDILSATTARQSVTTDNNGNYSVNVTPEKYGIFPDSQINYGGSAFYLYNTATSQDQYFIDANSGSVTQDLRFDNVTIDVNFFDQNNQPVSNAAVSVKDVYKDGTTTFAVNRPDILFTAGGGGTFNDSLFTGVNGTTTANVLRGIKYNVCAVDPASGVSVCSIFTPTANSSTVTLVTPPHHTINGKLTDRAGNPISGATFDIIGSSAPSKRIPVTTDSNGNYSVNVNPDTYSVFPDSQINNGGSGFYLRNMNVQYFVDARSSNVIQNFQFDNVALNVTFVDENNNPISDAAVSVRDQSGQGATTFAVGWPDIIYAGGGGGAFNDSLFTDVNGTTTANVLRGLVYNVCIIDPVGGIQHCVTSTPLIEGVNNVIVNRSASPGAPTGLVAPSPTKAPQLMWSAVAGATSYNIYANGTMIGASMTNSYTDDNPASGSNTYYVTAVNSGGESDISNVINLTVDITAPTVTNVHQVWNVTKQRTEITLTFSEIVTGLPQGWYGSGTTYTKAFYNTKPAQVTFVDAVGNTGSTTVVPVGSQL